MGVRVLDLLQKHSMTSIACIKFTRALLGLNSNMSSVIKNVNFAPGESSEIRVMIKTNKRRVVYKSYEGQERVNFKSVSNRGQFTHNGSLIASIVCNRTPKDSIANTLAAIGVYCKLGFEDATNLMRMYDAQYKFLRQAPWEIVRCTREKWVKFDTMKVGKVGELEIRPETEFEEGVLS